MLGAGKQRSVEGERGAPSNPLNITQRLCSRLAQLGLLGLLSRPSMVESPKNTLGGVGSGVGWSSGGCRCGRCARVGEVEHLHGSRPGWRSVLGGLLHLGECSCALLAWIPGFAHVLLENTCAACVLTTASEMLSQLRKCEVWWITSSTTASEI